MAILKQKCQNGHPQSWRCYSGAPSLTACPKCERERKEAERKAQKALDDQQKRDAQIQKHLLEVAKIQEEIDKSTQSMSDARLSIEQENTLAQKRKDLAAAKEMADKTIFTPLKSAVSTKADDFPCSANKSIQKSPQLQPSRTPKPSDWAAKLERSLKSCLDHNVSPSQTEWQRQKDQENASNPAIDMIMEMIGLEDVKSQVLRIKSKIETSIRQGIDLTKERLGLVLLGNPGTGKNPVEFQVWTHLVTETSRCCCCFFHF
jgi:hypothetical protein